MTIRKENVATGAWTGYSKMHDRYLYRQSNYNASPEDPAENEERLHHGKKAVNGGASETSDMLPLDL